MNDRDEKDGWAHGHDDLCMHSVDAKNHYKSGPLCRHVKRFFFTSCDSSLHGDALKTIIVVGLGKSSARRGGRRSFHGRMDRDDRNHRMATCLLSLFFAFG